MIIHMALSEYEEKITRYYRESRAEVESVLACMTIFTRCRITGITKFSILMVHFRLLIGWTTRWSMWSLLICSETDQTRTPSPRRSLRYSLLLFARYKLYFYSLQNDNNFCLTDFSYGFFFVFAFYIGTKSHYSFRANWWRTRKVFPWSSSVPPLSVPCGESNCPDGWTTSTDPLVSSSLWVVMTIHFLLLFLWFRIVSRGIRKS